MADEFPQSDDDFPDLAVLLRDIPRKTSRSSKPYASQHGSTLARAAISLPETHSTRSTRRPRNTNAESISGPTLPGGSKGPKVLRRRKLTAKRPNDNHLIRPVPQERPKGMPTTSARRNHDKFGEAVGAPIDAVAGTCEKGIHAGNSIYEDGEPGKHSVSRLPDIMSPIDRTSELLDETDLLPRSNLAIVPMQPDVGSTNHMQRLNANSPVRGGLRVNRGNDTTPNRGSKCPSSSPLETVGTSTESPARRFTEEVSDLTPSSESIDALAKEVQTSLPNLHQPTEVPAAQKKQAHKPLPSSRTIRPSENPPRTAGDYGAAKLPRRDKPCKKAFAQIKQELAESFLKELDKTITHGRLAELAKPTGGVLIHWSKKLNTTAGRASWKKEAARNTSEQGHAPERNARHIASIELAEKVIDDEHRLLNVVAHEFCHLANFMISGVTSNPHGKEFRIWAAQVSAKFGNRGVRVTTKHSYEIDFKYIWECEECGAEYKRHSKSINPERHRCGGCKGKLTQTRPTPRHNISEYQQFVQQQMRIVRTENPSRPQKDIMALIAQKWASSHGRGAPANEADYIGTAKVEDCFIDDLGKLAL